MILPQHRVAAPLRPLRRRWPVPVAVTAVAGVLLAGCGVPSETDVRVDGPVPDAGSAESGSPTIPPGPEQADSEEELVEYFLLAAAADPDDPLDALRAFIHPEEREGWDPDPQVVVLRTEDPLAALPDDPFVRVPVRETGVLGGDGIFEPRSGSAQRQVGFEVVEAVEVSGGEVQAPDVGEPRFWLVNPPNTVMLSAEAMDDSHRLLLPHPIYFWASDGETLVPDLRWLPSAQVERQRAQTVLEWLEDGPAPWLQGAVADLPDDVALAGNVVWGDDRVDVALTAAAADIDPTELNAQLWWTLWPVLANDRSLVLVVDGQERTLTGEYTVQNRTSREPPARFAVLDGEIRQQRPAERELELSALADGVNSDVESAALTRDGRAAALVRVEEDQRRLVIGLPGGPAETGLVGSRMGRPVWLASGQAGLVLADGELHRFTRDGEWSAVPVPGDLDQIEAIAVAPDARRLALVAGGQLHLASVGWRDGAVTVNEPRHLPTVASDLSGVGFLRENWLAIVGRDGDQIRLYEITVDRAVEQELPEDNLAAVPSVDSFVAYPGDPLRPSRASDTRGEIMFESDGRAYRYLFELEAVLHIQPDNLFGVSADDDTGDPRAPFFLD